MRVSQPLRPRALHAGDLKKVDGARGSVCGQYDHCGACGQVFYEFDPAAYQAIACDNRCPRCGATWS